MLIGEVSKQTGFSTDTIRYYEKIGLIQFPKNQRGENNYRQFDSPMIQRLFEIKSLKSFGFTLNEIKHFFELDKHNLVSCSNLSEIIHEKLEAIELKIRELQDLRTKLTNVKNDCDGNCKSYLYLN